MTDLTLISGDLSTVDARIDEHHQVWVPADALASATGWSHKPVGLCRDDVCIPTDRIAGLVDGDGRLALEVFAAATGTVAVIDVPEQVAVLGESAATHAERLRSGT